MMKMKKDRMVLVLILMAVLASGAMAESFTVATFADPSGDSSNPLFNIDWANETVSGQWADGQGNLTLQFSTEMGSASYDAWFEMDDLDIAEKDSIFGLTVGQSGQGQIRFYETGSSQDALLVLDFDEALISKYSLGADNVTISGQNIPVLSNEQFSFSFANVADFSDGDGFKATASFTSSAIPEPTTLAIFATATVIFGLKRTKK